MTDAATTDYLHRFTGTTDDDQLLAAYERASAADVTTVPPAAGALLRWFAALGPARTAVEIGSGAGTSGLWLLGGMSPKGTLTSIEPSPEGQDLARQAFSAAAVTDHVRSILGGPGQVLARLADAAYDLAVLIDDRVGWPEHLPELHRILRPGAILLAVGALCGGRVADPAVTDPEVSAVRSFNAILHEEDRWSAVLLPDADGLMMARAVSV